MDLWLQIVAVIEVSFLLAVVAAIVTKRTKLIFAFGFNVMIPVIALYYWHAPAQHGRGVLGLVMAGLYLLRLNWTILAWTGNTAMSKLDNALEVRGKLGLAFILVHSVGLGYCLPFYYIANDDTGLGLSALLALIVYGVGTVFHAGGDYQKRSFKQQPDTSGHVLQTGLWSLCRHPNYFGDFLIYVSFAVLAGHFYAWIAPVLNLLQYLFDAIPKNEQWASERYGDAWKVYERSTPRFFPLRFGRP